jgi:hypothetical protein
MWEGGVDGGVNNGDELMTLESVTGFASFQFLPASGCSWKARRMTARCPYVAPIGDTEHDQGR